MVQTYATYKYNIPNIYLTDIITRPNILYRTILSDK